VNCSTTRRITPTRSFVLAVFDNAGNGGVATGEGKHLGAPRAVVLRIILDEWDTLGIVVNASLLAIRTVWLGVNN
jgi:hypothetical protein